MSREQFTGGQIASTTRSGTNNVQGVVSYALRNPELAFVDDASATFGQKYQQNSLNAGAGGPLGEDEAFLFGAGSVSRRTNPLTSLLAANAQTHHRIERLAKPRAHRRAMGQASRLGEVDSYGPRSGRLWG